jgi:septal ring factor EnvC (AmiA/AmiB activator)
MLVVALPATALKVEANPIRKIVNLLENMQKEIEVEGEKEKVVFDNFMCFCDNGAADLLKAASDATAQNKAAVAKLEASSSEKAQLEEDIKTHTSDLETATADLEKATSIRDKEKADFDNTLATKKAGEDALGRAIPAIEKGMSGASFVQTLGRHGLRTIKRVVQSAQEVTDGDREDVLDFLQGKGAGGGEILGMLKAMKDELSRDIAALEKDEAAAVKGFGEMKASKEKEIEFADESIESKKERVANLAVEVVQLKDEIEDSAAEAADAEKFAASLEKQCAEKKKEWDQRCKMRSDEIAAIGEAIGILTDDDALDVFKKAVPSALVQEDTRSAGGYGYHHHRNMFTGEMVLLQTAVKPADAVTKVQAILANSKSNRVGLLLFTLKTKVRLAQRTGGAVDFSVIFKMIDDMVVVLKKQGKDDAAQKDFCVGELDKTEREKESADDKLANLGATIEEFTGELDTIVQGISDLVAGIAALDKDVAEATELRKKEHEEYAGNVQMQEVAIEIVGKAKNRLNKFYNPSAYKAPPKKEMSMEEKLASGGASALVQTEAAFDAPEATEVGFIQVRAKSRVAPPVAPEAPGGAPKKNEKSGGVLALMDMMVADLKATAQEARFTEKQAQKEYVELMEDSKEKRAQDQKSIVDQEGAKSEMESSLVEAKENQALAMDEQKNVIKTLEELHGQCDFLLKNFDMRLSAREAEIEGLQNAKAVLSGADPAALR